MLRRSFNWSGRLAGVDSGSTGKPGLVVVHEPIETGAL